MKSELDLMTFLPFRLNRIAGEISKRLAEIYGERFGIDVPQWRVLATLGQNEPTTARDIVHSTRTHKSTISRAVSQLMETGWVEGLESSGDRRRQLLRFSQLGREKYEEIVPLVLEVEAEILTAMGAAERQAISAALKALEGVLVSPASGLET